MEKLQQNYHININYIYFPLHPETPMEGISLQELFGPGADISAMTNRLRVFMEQEGLPFDSGPNMIYNSRLAQELAKWGESKKESDRLNMALYQAYFVAGQNIGDIQILLDIVQQTGLPVDEARQVLQGRTMKDVVDADWRHARQVGVTSVPTFAVGLTGVVGAQPYAQLAQLLEYTGAAPRSDADPGS